MKGKDRYMWLMVFFDLPVSTKTERREASRFRQNLIKDGFMMMQFSVYARICNGQEQAETHLRRLRGNLPCSGSVRALQVTQLQFGRMKILLGEKKSQMDTVEDRQLFLF